MTILDAVRAAHAAGLCVLPVAGDGSKRPAVPSWTPYQTTRPTSAQMRAWGFEFRDGFGMIAGPVSGHRESWDFDEPATFDAFIEAAAATGLGAVVQRIRDGYEDETPSGGRRWIVSYPADVDWHDTTLARRPGRDGESKTKTLVELTQFAILAPSNGRTHPTGGAYIRRSGDFATIAGYTVEERDALLTLARSFDEMPRREAAPSRPVSAGSSGDRPGDDFNRRASWPDLLPDWTFVYERNGTTYLRRPGKVHGVSATINALGTDRLHVFTSSTEFEPDQSYSKFGTYAVLHHNGDHARAALALSQQGYGDQGSTTTKATAAAPASDPAAAVTGFQQPAVTEGIGDCVLAPRLAAPYSGWFMRGGVHLIAGSSGAGKTTLMLDLLQQQERGGRYLGHVGQRLDYLVVFADRGKVSNDETLARMRIVPGSLS
ncbi:MAG: bifunctional DNA primase/polymerase, partial [Gemmatimonadaceae bacterium]|nr:bifunctional DNA primase/polymerase [Gemmatimonadaceae bacterium]